jgi:hypothetical protein
MHSRSVSTTQRRLVQTLAFLVAGFGTLGLAYAMRKLIAHSRASTIGISLLAVYGVGALLVAIFPTERVDGPADVWPQGIVSTIHIVASFVSFIGLTIAMLVCAWVSPTELTGDRSRAGPVAAPSRRGDIRVVHTGGRPGESPGDRRWRHYCAIRGRLDGARPR